MTEPEFRERVTEIAAEELEKQTAEGLFPTNTDQARFNIYSSFMQR